MFKERLPANPYSRLVHLDFRSRNGNIIIVTRCPAFKVHRNTPECYSEIFSDCSPFFQPAEQDPINGGSSIELQEGCPSDVF